MSIATFRIQRGKHDAMHFLVPTPLALTVKIPQHRTPEARYTRLSVWQRDAVVHETTTQQRRGKLYNVWTNL